MGVEGARSYTIGVPNAGNAALCLPKFKVFETLAQTFGPLDRLLIARARQHADKTDNVLVSVHYVEAIFGHLGALLWLRSAGARSVSQSPTP